MNKLLLYLALLCSVPAYAATYVETDYDAPIHKAVREGRYDKAEVILKIMPEVASKKAAFGQSPLHIAIKKNNLKCADLLLGFKADVDAQDNHKQTPLHLAVAASNLRAVQLLLQAGASVIIKDEHEKTVLDLAAQKELAEIIAHLEA